MALGKGTHWETHLEKSLEPRSSHDFPSAHCMLYGMCTLPSCFPDLVTSEWFVARDLGNAHVARQGSPLVPLAAGDKRVVSQEGKAQGHANRVSFLCCLHKHSLETVSKLGGECTVQKHSCGYNQNALRSSFTRTLPLRWSDVVAKCCVGRSVTLEPVLGR